MIQAMKIPMIRMPHLISQVIKIERATKVLIPLNSLLFLFAQLPLQKWYVKRGTLWCP